jgi:hypothetical protein
MHPALAGVIVPTIALIALMAIPYYDRSNEGQGEWMGTPRAWKLTFIGAATGIIGTVGLILWDGAKHVVLWAKLTGQDVTDWPTQLNFLRNARALQNDIAWPGWTRRVPVGDWIPSQQLGLPAIDLNVDLAGVLVEQIIPVSLMIGLPIVMSIVLWRLRIARTRRDHMIAQFSGFIAVYIILTIFGTALRGEGMELFWPQDVHPPVS